MKKQDHERILKAAEAALAVKPFSVTFSHSPLSEGGVHDFFSMGDYFWPNPATPDGKPYVMRDGESNPENFNECRIAVMGMRDSVANGRGGDFCFEDLQVSVVKEKTR